MSNEVVEKILGNPDQIKLGGNLTVATILFSDIRGHTSIAEKMNPQKTVEMLNEYFSEMTEVIFKYRGTLNKFIRDGIMAVFGVPISEGSSADALKTVLAALEMQRQIEALNKRWDKVEGRSLLRIGMGIGTGEVLVGNIGFFARMEYTVIGDAVNVASRLEELTKEHQCGIIISEDTYEKVKNEIAVEPFRSTDIRGRSTRIEIYKVLGLKPSRLAGQEVMTHKK